MCCHSPSCFLSERVRLNFNIFDHLKVIIKQFLINRYVGISMNVAEIG
jgi:hypothetical protein